MAIRDCLVRTKNCAGEENRAVGFGVSGALLDGVVRQFERKVAGGYRRADIQESVRTSLDLLYRTAYV